MWLVVFFVFKKLSFCYNAGISRHTIISLNLLSVYERCLMRPPSAELNTSLYDVWCKRAWSCPLLSARVWSPWSARLYCRPKRWILVFESTPLYHESSKQGERRGFWAWHLLTTDIHSPLAASIWCSCGAERPSRAARHERLRLTVPVRGRPGGTGARAAPEDT